MAFKLFNQITNEGYSLENLTSQIKQLTSKPVLTSISYVENFSYENYFNKFKSSISLSDLGFEDL